MRSRHKADSIGHQDQGLNGNSKIPISGVCSTQDVQCVTHLLSLAQMFCEQPKNATVRVCHEVARVTQGRTQLYLSQQKRARKVLFPASMTNALPVQFQDRRYGTLCVVGASVTTEEPPISLDIAQLLAQACGWLLHTIEISALLQGQFQQLEYQVHGSLTKREHEVLVLMGHGYNQDAIAAQLHIASSTVHKHRQHIYEQLGVHCERDAILAAFDAGILSFIEDSAETVD